MNTFIETKYARKNMLPTREEMYHALLNKDSSYEGIFFAGITTTGIFCRPVCHARKPKVEHVQYFSSVREALLAGYRPCKKCRPLEASAKAPPELQQLLEDIETHELYRLKDQDLRNRGLDPSGVRRWFNKNHGMTFQAFLRSLRVGKAFGRLRDGDTIMQTAYHSGYESVSGFTEAFKKHMNINPSDTGKQNIILIRNLSTPVGPMIAGATDKGICLLEFLDRRMLETESSQIRKLYRAELVQGTHQFIAALEKEMHLYFSGKLRIFTVPLDMRGTDFQLGVWRQLMTIPYGHTRSYGEQAKAVGDMKAVRAVARANGDNRIAVIIPCHRVIGADGQLTGYGGGLWRKKYLLDLESGHL